MPTATVDGIETYYEELGDGPPLLMFSPGGFGAELDNWSELGRYRQLRLLDYLSQRYRCIAFDRRESGRSGGRIERMTWRDYAAQGQGLLEHLGIQRAHLMGGCVGCSIAAVFAVEYPAASASLVLFSPAGGVKYRLKQHLRFAQHVAYVEEHGLEGVVELGRSHDEGFSSDPRVGPWVTVIRNDDDFASGYAAQDAGRYVQMVLGVARTMFDRDTVPGPEPEDLLIREIPALIIPGQDSSHATSAARFLEECLPLAEYWDVPVPEQTEETVAPHITEFLDRVEGRG